MESLNGKISTKHQKLNLCTPTQGYKEGNKKSQVDYVIKKK